mmetsp:Transcript_1111/g.1716  ORF Transcript_1111/g.1716 Transcript_1111/m.1716 type:complete len:186 (+) Transcript_1111:121-678(+)
MDVLFFGYPDVKENNKQCKRETMKILLGAATLDPKACQPYLHEVMRLTMASLIDESVLNNPKLEQAHNSLNMCLNNFMNDPINQWRVGMTAKGDLYWFNPAQPRAPTQWERPQHFYEAIEQAKFRKYNERWKACEFKFVNMITCQQTNETQDPQACAYFHNKFNECMRHKIELMDEYGELDQLQF